MNFFDLFLFVFPELKAILKVLSLLGTNYQRLWKMFLKSPEKFSEEIGKLGVAGRKELSSILTKTQQNIFSQKALGKIAEPISKEIIKSVQLAKLPVSQKKDIIKRAVRGKIVNTLLPMVKKIPNRYDKITPQSFKPIKKKWNELVDRIMLPKQQGTDFALLSSSWIVSGSFDPDPTGQAGELTITTKQGKSYPYPGVALRTWEAMKKATGSHGTGAGSVFWIMYLHKWRASATRQWMTASAYRR